MKQKIDKQSEKNVPRTLQVDEQKPREREQNSMLYLSNDFSLPSPDTKMCEKRSHYLTPR